MTIQIIVSEAGADGQTHSAVVVTDSGSIDRERISGAILASCYEQAAAQLRNKLREVSALCSPSTPVPAISDR